MLKDISRDDLDHLLFKAMRAVYRLERAKVALFGLTYEGIYLLQFLRRQSPASMGAIAKEAYSPGHGNHITVKHFSQPSSPSIPANFA